MYKDKAVIGVDVGGTNTITGLIDAGGKIIEELKFTTQDFPIFDDYIDRLCQNIDVLQKAYPDYEIAGIGIGAPSANWSSGMVEKSANIYWYERDESGGKGKHIELVPFVEILKQRYPLTHVVIDNDANVTAYGEMIYGGAKGMKNFIEITLGTGVGSGIVANGRMIYGQDGTAGELGHVIVEREGRICGCGRRGCLETYVSASGIVRTLLEILSTDPRGSKLRDIPDGVITSKLIYEAARRGDELALETFEKTGKILGEALANFVSFILPEAIFLFGGVANAGKILFEPTKRHMEKSILRNYKNKVKLLPSGIQGAGAALLGASALVWIDIYK